MATIDILLSKIVIDDGGCWVFTGATSRGYGQIKVNGRIQRTHVIAYEYYKGPVNGLFVCHSCDNPSCCNSEHLFLGTPRDNVTDMRVKGRDRYGENIGERNGQAKLNVEDVIQIRQLLSTGYNKTYIGNLFEVSRKTIAKIEDKVTWRHI